MAASTSLARAHGRILAPAGDHQGNGRVLGRGQSRQEVVLLEHEADVLGPEPGLRPIAHPGDVVAEDGHLAFVGVEDAGDHREQRGLAAARGPDDQRHLAGVDVQIDPRQRLDALISGPEVLGQPPDPDGDATGV